MNESLTTRKETERESVKQLLYNSFLHLEFRNSRSSKKVVNEVYFKKSKQIANKFNF